MKIPPHPTGLQLLQQRKDITNCKDYLHFQIHPGSDHLPFERNTAITVGQQSYKLPKQRRWQLKYCSPSSRRILSLTGETPQK